MQENIRNDRKNHISKAEFNFNAQIENKQKYVNLYKGRVQKKKSGIFQI